MDSQADAFSLPVLFSGRNVTVDSNNPLELRSERRDLQGPARVAHLVQDRVWGRADWQGSAQGEAWCARIPGLVLSTVPLPWRERLGQRACPLILPWAVVDFGRRASLVHLSATSSLRFLHVDLQGELRLMGRRGVCAMPPHMPPAASHVSECALRTGPRSREQNEHESVVYPIFTSACLSLAMKVIVPPARPVPGIAPASAVLSTAATAIEGSPLWPSVDGAPGHKVELTDCVVNAVVTPCSRNATQLTVDLLRKVGGWGRGAGGLPSPARA